VVAPTSSTALATTATQTAAAAPQAGGAGGNSWLLITGAALCGSLALALAGYLTLTRLRRR
jgi:hypothetical protein